MQSGLWRRMTRTRPVIRTTSFWYCTWPRRFPRNRIGTPTAITKPAVAIRSSRVCFLTRVPLSASAGFESDSNESAVIDLLQRLCQQASKPYRIRLRVLWPPSCNALRAICVASSLHAVTRVTVGFSNGDSKVNGSKPLQTDQKKRPQSHVAQGQRSIFPIHHRKIKSTDFRHWRICRSFEIAASASIGAMPRGSGG